MRTTVEIPDALLRAAREYCGRLGLSFRQLIESGLRLAIEQPPPFGFPGEGQQIQDWSSIRAAIYEGRGDLSAPVQARGRRAR
jgi:hypothetical protein